MHRVTQSHRARPPLTPVDTPKLGTRWGLPDVLENNMPNGQTYEDPTVRTYGTKPSMAAGPPNAATVVTCVHCDSKPIEVAITGTDGHRLTVRACCRTQWFCDGEAVALASVTPFMRRRSSP
jgi:hypothetical protein